MQFLQVLLGCLYHFAANQNLTTSFSVGGFYTGTNFIEPWLNATYHTFAPGRYSAIAFDSWRQSVKLNFTVVA